MNLSHSSVLLSHKMTEQQKGRLSTLPPCQAGRQVDFCHSKGTTTSPGECSQTAWTQPGQHRDFQACLVPCCPVSWGVT